MSKDAPPRIHTLRSDGQVPKTSDCFTPRTIEGTDGAFKTPAYGQSIEGPYRRSDYWTTRLLWAGIVLIIIAAGALVYFKT